MLYTVLSNLNHDGQLHEKGTTVNDAVLGVENAANLAKDGVLEPAEGSSDAASSDGGEQESTDPLPESPVVSEPEQPESPKEPELNPPPADEKPPKQPTANQIQRDMEKMEGSQPSQPPQDLTELGDGPNIT